MAGWARRIPIASKCEQPKIINSRGLAGYFIGVWLYSKFIEISTLLSELHDKGAQIQKSVLLREDIINLLADLLKPQELLLCWHHRRNLIRLSLHDCQNGQYVSGPGWKPRMDHIKEIPRTV